MSLLLGIPVGFPFIHGPLSYLQEFRRIPIEIPVVGKPGDGRFQFGPTNRRKSIPVSSRSTSTSATDAHWPGNGQLALLFLVSALVLGALTFSLTQSFQERRMAQQLSREADQTFASIRNALADPTLSTNRQSFEKWLGSTLSAHSDLAAFRMSDSNDRVIASWERETGTDRPFIPVARKDFSQELQYKGTRYGTLLLEWDQESRQAAIWINSKQTGAAVLVALTLFGLVAWFGFHRALRQRIATLSIALPANAEAPQNSQPASPGQNGFAAHPFPESSTEAGPSNALDDFETRVEARTLALRQEIAEHKAAEAAAHQARTLAENANQAKSEFLATISHEIRTPMNAVLGFANILLGTRLDEEQRDFVQTIRSSGESLLTLINDILDFSKIEAGRLQLENIVFDLAQITEEVAALLSSKAEEKHVELAVFFDPQLPRTWVGDPIRVRQVLMNLVGNAIKFTERGYVSIDVSLQADPSTESNPKRFAQIRVRDTGVGIGPEKRHLLFQKFQQVDSSTTRRFGGTGLGLAICRLLVERMGGFIGVDSQLGQGSTFYFTLPWMESDASLSVLPLQPDPEVRKARVLIVDDLDINRDNLQRQLTHWGLSTQTAASATEALTMLRQAAESGASTDIVFVDFSLPDRDVLALVREIRKDDALRSIGLILMASGGQRFDTTLFIAGGFAGTLLKPMVRQPSLLESLRKGLDQRRHLLNAATTPTVSSSDNETTAAAASQLAAPSETAAAPAPSLPESEASELENTIPEESSNSVATPAETTLTNALSEDSGAAPAASDESTQSISTRTAAPEPAAPNPDRATPLSIEGTSTAFLTAASSNLPKINIRVLLAEDNAVNQKLARRLLESFGCHVTVAANGREAVDRVMLEVFDLVLMDCQMPELDGFEATREMRRLENEGGIARRTETRLPIVALTANAVQGDRDRCLACGMDDYVSKPVSTQELREAVWKWTLGRQSATTIEGKSY